VHQIDLYLASPVDRRLLAEFLTGLGYRVCVADLSDPAPTVRSGVSLVIADIGGARRYDRRLLELKWRAGPSFLPFLILLSATAKGEPWLAMGYDDIVRQPISKVELKARLEALLRYRSQSEQYRAVFEDALIGLGRIDAEGRVVLANTAFATMLGYDSFADLANAGAAASRVAPAPEELDASLQENGHVVGLASIWRRADGGSFHALENIRLVRDPEGDVLYYETSIEDITERERLHALEREARLQAETASRLKDEFLAAVSHELRTPLTAIIGWATILREEIPPDTTASEGLEIIERQGRAQSKLIDDLLDISRIITGKLRLELRRFDIAEAINAAIEAIRPSAELKGVRLVASVEPGVGMMTGDAARLQQVVWNLLSNAVKFTACDGLVELRLERVDGAIEIVVSDTGEGISADFLPYVFDRFRQADGRTTRRHGGLGLGLAIVHNLVGLHNGSVRVESGGRGHGARFTVRLPTTFDASAPASADGATATTTPRRPSLDGLDVLVVDDDPDTRSLLRSVLARSGARVATACDVAEALVHLDAATPDVLVSDIGMPGRDGFELIREVRARLGAGIPAVAVTAYTRGSDRDRALEEGFQAFVGKPIEPDALVEVVAGLTGRGRRT